ncbi:MAG: hypothetical protein KC420_17625, partial [Myxococcales bacterium]|nr:hypothetical protein [Myxococcales bacterium]
MPLLKRRPEIQVFSPRAVLPGRPFVTRVVLACSDAVGVSAVDVELRGAYVWFVDTQYGQSRSEEVFYRQRARVAERGELAAGEHAFAARFVLPAEAPATYQGEELRIEYSLHVHVDIPWWPDARAAFVVQVSPPPAEAAPGEGRVFASHAGGAPGGDPYLEVSLGSTDIEAGERLEGAVALANTATNAYRSVELALVAVESVHRPLGRHTHHRRVCAWSRPIEAIADNAPIRLMIALPDALVPGFDLGACSLRWFLEVRARVSWSRDPRVWIPLQVLGPRVAADGGERRAPLAVGSERLELVWRSVAEARSMSYEGGVLRQRIGEVELQISREHRGRAGAVVVGELGFPDLGIGLAIGGRGRALQSRDMTQATWLIEHLGEALSRRPPVDASDLRLRFELEDAGQDRATLLAFIDELLALAALVDERRLEIPPPTAMAAMVPAWEAAARHLGARLRPAAMAISGRADASTVEIRTEWDERGRPLQTVLELRPSRPIDQRHH